MRLVSFFGGACRAAVLAALAMLALGAFAASASAAGAGFGIKNFESGTCTENGQATAAEECTYKTESKFYTQAAGHPPFGITDFEFNTIEDGGAKIPDENVKNIRTDLPLGLSVNPEAVPQCTMAEFGEVQLEEGVFAKPVCAEDTKVGTDVLTVLIEPAKGVYANYTLTGTAYNLVPPDGAPLEIGVAIDISTLEGEPVETIYAHTLLEGGVSWHSGETYATSETATNAGSHETVPYSGNYHEYFKIDDVSKAIPLVASRLIFEGTKDTGTGPFLTMPSSCGAATTDLWVESYAEETATKPTTPPKGVEECAKVPFKPEVNVKPATTQADSVDGATVEVKVPQNTNSAQINSSTLQNAEVTLPEGMTFNPAAANGLTACTEAEFGKGTANAVTCPESSKIGTVNIETPTLPAGVMKGNVYVGTPNSSSPASGNEYRIFIAAEAKSESTTTSPSKNYGVDIRLEGKVKANETTGQLTTLVAENPPIPFSDFELKLENGTRTPLANPITCAAQSTTGSFIPTSTGVAVAGALTETFTTTGCATFAPTQTTKVSDTQGGASTSFAFELTRPEGQPWVSTVSTTLPPGLVGKIPSVPLCTEAQASSETCPATSAIGTATVEVGSGTVPLGLSGTVYLTEAYGGAPYGLDIVTNAEKVGPYDYGLINTRAKIEVNSATAQVTVASQLPTVVGGAPIRLRALNVTVTHANFMINPTSCSALTTSTALTSTTGVSATATSPFQATGCSSLKFKPKFKAGSNGKPTKKEGASLKTTLTLPAGDANVKSVSVTLPKKLPSRGSTLEKACLLATFDASPGSCPKASKVGTASVVTPVLPGTLKGTAYYVSLGHAGFPNLDIVLKGDGVTIVLVGQTNIKGGITHTKFLTLPDVPVTTFTLQLPMKENSALSANASLCKKPLYLPTTMEAQNGAKFTQDTRINMTACPVVITKHKVKSKTVQISVKTPSAGKIVASGTNLARKTKKVAKAKVATITETLTAAGARKLAFAHKLNLTVRVKFTPKTGKASKTSLKVKLKG